MKKPLVIRTSKVDDALRDEPRGLRKVVVPELYPDKEILHRATEWESLGFDKENPVKKKPVVESDLLQLSYFNKNARQKSHWHGHQIEIYSVIRGRLSVALKDVDNDADFETYFDIERTVIIPPRFCHRVRIEKSEEGEEPLVEVIQFAVASVDTAKDQQMCDTCPQHPDCSDFKASQLLSKNR